MIYVHQGLSSIFFFCQDCHGKRLSTCNQVACVQDVRGVCTGCGVKVRPEFAPEAPTEKVSVDPKPTQKKGK